MHKVHTSLADIYDIDQKIDEGAFGFVYRARNRETKELVAIKRFKQHFSSWAECVSLNEVRYLKDLEHANVVKLKEVVMERGELYLVYEYADTNLLKFYSYYRRKVG